MEKKSKAGRLQHQKCKNDSEEREKYKEKKGLKYLKKKKKVQ